MDNNKENVPKIRFPGFTDPWEQRKLSDETNSIDTGKSKFSSKNDGKYEILGSTSVIGYDNNYDYEGDFLLTARVGANAGELYRHSGKVKISDNTVFIQGENLDFTYYMLMNFDIKKLSFGTGQPLVKASELKELKLTLPVSEEEKIQIGKFFHNFDNLITLHQRKLNHLQDKKRGLLQKMFPKNGEKFPELRFPGFADPWEQRKLGDVFEEYSEKNHEELPPLTIIQGKGTIRRDESDRNLQFDKKSLLNYKMVEKDDFIVHLRSFEGGLEKSNFTGIISPAYHTLHGNGADSRFYYAYFRSHNFINVKLKPHVYGIRDGRSIDMVGMKTINIPFTSLNEQKKIGDFIESLDTLITFHQRKLEHLQQQKKGLLQQMFV
ncbi:MULTISPECIES: restriction endonuclease subunit S [unclassified Sedimentibacter]|uniref:restriction endonuclease subunit S n=1 Tax=unclassified Sedimentibacter TaxID=2649220 RepID=UPI0027E01969|nr:restriction endonuclease subunit S [Sedimentibacter sp. MB35-C1]WMJ76943.1 restriction endonuclease subunit S [Sedimentibacter sp. MB35-C1]